MPAREFTTLFEGGAFFEGPRWRDGRWWVSDFYGHVVMMVAPDGAAATVMSVEQQPSGLGWMPDGSLLVVSMRDHRVLRRSSTGEVSVHADLTAHCVGHLNDMVVDRRGRRTARRATLRARELAHRDFRLFIGLRPRGDGLSERVRFSVCDCRQRQLAEEMARRFESRADAHSRPSSV